MSELRSDDNEPRGPEDSAASKGLTILIPDTESPAEPSGTGLEDGDLAHDESARALYEEGDSFAGLKLEHIWDAGVSSPVSISEDIGKEPDIDVVHVVGAVTSQHTVLSLSGTLGSMLPYESGKRELLFFVNIASLLNNDVEFTRRSVNTEAHRLLSGLKHFQHSDTELSRKAIIFIAYDLGAIILQKAISIASLERPGEPGIFTDTARTVFCGCFLRAENEEKMGIEMFKFLDDGKNSEDWSNHLTLSAVQNLVSVSKEARLSFLRSKIALRSRVISLYAGPKGGHIQTMFDYLTATLGIATELAVQEEGHDGNISDFPYLAANLCNSSCGWAPNQWQAALEYTLMSMVPQNAQMLSTTQSQNHPIFASAAYQTWRSQSGTKVLYIDGPDHQANIEAVEQIGLKWVRDRSFNGRSGNVFSFLFDSRDPLRNSIGPMLTAAFLNLFWSGDPSNIKTYCAVFRDHLKLQNAWLEQDILNIACLTYTWMDEHIPIFFLGLDECDTRSREEFWTLLGEISNKSEEPIKLVITSNKPGGLGWSDVLRAELKRWPEIKLLEHTNSPDEVSEPVAHPMESINVYHERLISRLCPIGISAPGVRADLERLKSMDRSTLDTILHLLETYSRWPATQSITNLATFCSVLKNVYPSSTPHAILDSILQSIPDQNWLRWLLRWNLFGQRPLTLSEVSMLLCYCTKNSVGQMSVVGDEDIQRSVTEIDGRLRGLVELNEDRIHISGDVVKIWEESGRDFELLDTVKQTAPETTANFLLDYLRLPHVQDRLNGLYEQYEGVIERSKGGLAPPLIPDGRDGIFYAVHALPHHLSRITIPDDARQAMRDPNGPYTAWAKVFWAMSNPLSRPIHGPLIPAWAAWEMSPEFGPFNLVRTRLDDETSNEGKKEDEVLNTQMDRLVAAVKANNEDLSVVLAEQVLADSNQDKHTLNSSAMTDKDEPRIQVHWPSSIIWRATWLGMNRLLELLLRDGLRDEDDKAALYSPSLLYAACRMGNSDAVDLLVRKGADVKVKRVNSFTPLYAASVRGKTDILRTLLEKDGSMLEEPQPSRPLYGAAAWGCWKAVGHFIESGADPNMFMSKTPVPAAETDDLESNGVSDWTPLTAACSSGYVKTARVLLENGADPNKNGPSANRLPLHFAAVEDGSVEMTRLLLKHKANPNHALLQPPVLTAIIERDLSDEIKMTLFNILLENDPPVEVDKPGRNGQTALIAAAIKEDMAAIRWLLEHGADINAVDSDNRHALFYALLNRKHLAVEELLKHREKPRLELCDNSRQSLVQATVGNTSLLRMLVEAGADLTYENGAKQTILNLAVVGEDTEMVKYLLSLGKEKDVDIHHRDSSEWTPILDATGFLPNVEVVRILMEYGARLSDVDSSGWSPLHRAAEGIRPDILRVLLEYHTAEHLNTHESYYGNTPLLAIQRFQEPQTLDCIRLLVRAGANVNAQNTYGSTPLMKTAAFGPEAEVVHEYLLSRPEIDVKVATSLGITALHTACEFSDVALVAKLLKHGADPNARALILRSTPLIAACFSSRRKSDIEAVLEDVERIVRDLVSHGADINAMSGTSLFSPLCAASLCAGVGTINHLLDKSASVQQADPLGRLPIHFAAANGLRNFEAVALVHGDDIMVCDRFKKNALHWAAEFGHVDTVRAILERLSPEDRKVHVNAGDVDGWTPLAWACRPTAMDIGSYWTMSEQPEFVATIRCLLGHGADKFARFYIGLDEESMEEFTPLKMAKRCALDDDVLRLLDVEQNESIESDRASQEESEKVLLVDEKKYPRTRANCEFCLSQIWGTYWACMSCDKEQYVLCKKCYRRGHLEHQRTVADDRKGEDHLFEIAAHRKQEFEDPPSAVSSVRSPSIAGSDVGAAGGQDTPVNQQAEEEVTPGLDDGNYEIEQLDFPDLDDLGGLSV